MCIAIVIQSISRSVTLPPWPLRDRRSSRGPRPLPHPLAECKSSVAAPGFCNNCCGGSGYATTAVTAASIIGARTAALEANRDL